MQSDDRRKSEHGVTANPGTEIAAFDKREESIHGSSLIDLVPKLRHAETVPTRNPLSAGLVAQPATATIVQWMD
jgi:hypothetical protein